MTLRRRRGRAGGRGSRGRGGARGGGRAGGRGGDRGRRARHPPQRQRLRPRGPGRPLARRRVRLARPRSAAASCVPATRSAARCGPRAATSATRRSIHVETRERRARRAARRAALVRRPHRRLPLRAAARRRRRSARVPYGRGSRVAIAGPPGAGATTLLREIVAALSEGADVPVPGRARRRAPRGGGRVGRRRAPTSWAAASTARPRRRPRPPSSPSSGPSAAWSAATTPSWSSTLSTRSPRARAAACSAPAAPPRRAARSRSSRVTGDGSEALRWATTRIVLEPGGPESRAAKVVRAQSGTLRADRL